jgi:hypothetical protein
LLQLLQKLIIEVENCELVMIFLIAWHCNHHRLSDGSMHTYPFSPHRDDAAVFGLARQLDSQQSPPSQPHSAVLAAPLLQRPLPRTNEFAMHTAGVAVGVVVGLLVAAMVGLPVG